MAQIGSWITIPHPSIIEIMCQQKFDWLCIDLEHSPVSRLDLQIATTIIQGYQKKAFARVKENSHSSIKFALDAGIDGIIIPMVNSATEARNAVKNCLYPPHGIRGAGLSRAQKFGPGFQEHYQKNISELIVIVQVEHINAVKEIDDILKIDKISGVFIGPYDLSGSMNCPGDFLNQKLQEAIERVAKATLNSNKILGIHVIQPKAEEILNYFKLGYNFIAFSLDSYFLQRKLSDELDLLFK